jgi:hypothetical protein
MSSTQEVSKTSFSLSPLIIESAVDEQKLSWTMDRTDSLSDWTIDIVDASSGSVKSYYVHRVILAVGPRACGYFKALFRITTKETEEEKSRIEFQGGACSLFPLVLDFLYESGDFVINVDNAVGLAYLAEYFMMPKLLKQLESFIEASLTKHNLIAYYRDAEQYGRRDIQDLVAGMCARRVAKWGRDSSYLHRMGPGLFVDVLSRTLRIKVDMVAKYCSIHKDELSKHALEEITSDKILPKVGFNAAIELLDVEAVVRKGEHDDTADQGPPDITDNTLTSLQKRCIKALAKKWEDADTTEPDLKEKLKNLSVEVMRELLPRIISEANDRVAEAEERVRSLKSKKRKVKAFLEETEASLVKFKNSMEHRGAALKSSLEEWRNDAGFERRYLSRKRFKAVELAAHGVYTAWKSPK